MDTATFISCTIVFLGTAGGVIAVYVKSNEKLALAKQQVDFLQRNVDKLESRVDDLEKHLAEKVEVIHDDIHEIKISITKLLDK